MNGMTEQKVQPEDVVYSSIGQYEAVVSILETLRYCSDRRHPLHLSEIYIRCARFTTNWLRKKTLQRGMKLLLELGREASWVRECGGRVVKVISGENGKFYYYWEKNECSAKTEQMLRDRIRRGEDVALNRCLLGKLGLDANLENEEKWREMKGLQKRLDAAVYIDVKTPYTEMIYEKEDRKMGGDAHE